VHAHASRHQRTRPYTPRHNGKVERYQRILAEECLYADAFYSEDERHEAISGWVHHYNYHRPHTAGADQPPATRVHERVDNVMTLIQLARAARHLPAVQAHSAQAPHDRPVSGRADRGDGAAERRVPGHWEGDLIIGKNGTSCAATLVERMIGFTGLLALPSKHAETTADAVIEYFNELPEMMRASLARDQGSEMAQHSKVSLATSIP